MAARLEHWDPAWGPLTEANLRRHLENEGYTVQRYEYPPGTFFSEHTHAMDKKDAVLKGRLRIETDDGAVILEAGDIIEIPSEMAHTAEVVGHETVVSLDATRINRGKT